ncbi:hypothetical protein HerbRD11066_71660 [Herbidospora sp. RD11066]
MDRQALRLRERLFFWTCVLFGAMGVFAGGTVPLFHALVDIPEVDPGAVVIGYLGMGGGVVLLLIGMVMRRRSRRSWVVPGLFLVLGVVGLVYLAGLPVEPPKAGPGIPRL